MELRIVPVTTLGVDPAEVGLARAWDEVFVASAEATMGSDNDVWSFASRQAREQATDWERRYLAGTVDPADPRADATVVAAGELELPLCDNPELAIFAMAVHPDHLRQGHGAALLDHVERQAREAARTSLITQTAYLSQGGDPGEGFLRSNGFEIAQTMLRNDLPTSHPLAPAPTTAGYVIETSTDDTLDAWLEDRAMLQTRMSTDVPLGDLDFVEEVWDAARIDAERRSTRTSERRAIESVARHIASGRLVGFTRMEVPTTDPSVAYQQDTLVIREHRGRGLGLALKAASMAALTREFPSTRIVRTWNAVENAQMLAVNTALGYRPSATLREWQKRLR